MLNLLWELVRKDLKIFLSDRKALLISFAVPVAIASFMGILTDSMSHSGAKPASKMPIAVAMEDKGSVADDIMARLHKSDSVEVRQASAEQARKWVKDGTLAFAVIVPPGFTEKAVDAMGTETPGPELETLSDPSRQMESQIARGNVQGAIMSGVVKAKYGEVAGSGKMPFSEASAATKVDASNDPMANWSGTAHAFAGMGVQGLLFWSIEAAMGILRERRQGIWRRLRASPVSPFLLLLGKILSGAIRAMAILTVVFGAGALIFHMRIGGSLLGFALVALAVSLMAAAFGMFVAALGRTEQQSRGLSILAVLGMVMLGGAWFPMALMPGWIQKISLVIPVRWAVDGFDGMTWRAQGLAAALPSVGVLLLFAIVFATIALRRIKWDYEA
jgi:ABC-2 type transport system permease protein